jgi:ribosomal protein S13
MLQIPKRVKNGLFIFSSLKDSDKEILFSLLDKKPGELELKKLRDSRDKIGDISPEQMRYLINSLVSIQRLSIDSETPIDDLIDSICTTLESPEEHDFKLTDELSKQLKQNLKRFLKIAALTVHSKAIDLQVSNERTYCESRIITDLRPVFGRKLEEGIKGSVIRHSLHITYHQNDGGDEHKTFFVILDLDDVKELKLALERAEAKQKVLEQSLKLSGIPYINE